MTDGRSRSSRWLYVAAAVGTVGTAGTYQFSWPAIRGALGAQAAASGTALGTIFSVMVVAQTLTAFPAGWTRDRYGPRIPFFAAAALLFSGFVGAAFDPTLPALFLWFALGGAGVGIAYDVAINTPSRWFVSRRGMATGAVSMAFSGTSFLLISVIKRSVETDFSATLLALGVASGVTAVTAALVVHDPDERDSTGDGSDESAGDSSPDGSSPSGPDVTWRTMVRTRRFWVLYVVFAVVNGVGLLLVEKVVVYAAHFGLSTTAAVTAASLVALGQASGVIVVGTASDRLGRVRTLTGSLVCCGIALAAMVAAGGMGAQWAFVALAGVTMFFRSPSFSILPGLVGEYYGEEYSSENYAVMLTAKLWGGIYGGVGTSLLVLRFGWSPTFLLGAGLAFVAGVGGFLTLRGD
ncbi:oxalate:formate antiporter [Haladaptatus sp. W1]|uniref:MFS transporter n=1 Tax=Haladaptatus sp. W1 TaxID=1897478 RepID=UPI0008499733|nr:MFS transporter [Haladaptatus sp. W1]ODR82890.1 oxalate:formate antiporter [Haladaptatus sp. W1]